jgi:hypothetical protein
MIYVDDVGIFSSDENIKEVLKDLCKRLWSKISEQWTHLLDVK